MRKIASRLFDTKALGIFACTALAAVGLVGCLISLSAMAEQGDITVSLNNATISGDSRTAVFDLGNSETVAFDIGGSYVISSPDNSPYFTIPAPGGDPVSIEMQYIGNSNACDLYSVVLNQTLNDEPDAYNFSCEATNGEYLFTAGNNYRIPNGNSSVSITVSKKTQSGNTNPGDSPVAPQTAIVSIAANEFGQDNKTATFNFGENVSRSITFTNAYNTETHDFAFQYNNQSDLHTSLMNGLTFTTNTPCMDGEADDYVVQLGTQGGWSKTFSCNNGSYSLALTSDDNVDPNDNLSIRITSSNQHQQHPDNYTIEFENMSAVDDEQHYIKVTSHDESLAGKVFILTPSNGGPIGCVGDEGGNHCSQQFNTSPFDQNSDIYYTIAGDGFDLDLSSFMVILRGPDGLNVQAEVVEANGHYQFQLRNTVPADTTHVHLAIEEPHQQGGGEDERPVHPGNPVSPATVTIKNNLGGGNFNKSFYLGRLSINWTELNDRGKERCEGSADDRANDTTCPTTYTFSNFTYNKEDEATKVEISFGTLFIHRFINTIKVNGTTYQIPLDYTNRQAWLQAYDHQMTGFTIEVPYNENGYTIEFDVDNLPGEYQQIGNFLWSNDEREKGRDEYIGHSNLEVVSVNCHITDRDEDDVFFNVATDDVPAGCVFEYRPDDDIITTGSLVVPEGSTITVRLKPIYGWQVTSFRINDGDEILTDPGKVAQYTFGIHKGNAHLGAVVTEVNNEVKASSDKVKSGSISLGGLEITEGTAMLSVDDADLTDEQKAEFQAQAGNYNVSTYLDIDLDQVFYNGQGGYWQGAEMNELQNEATITLTLEEGVDGNSVILVHKKHDETYEIIPTTYNAATHSITFKTSSFSDYAIASANVANAKTGDRALAFFVVFLISANASIIMFAQAKKEAEKAQK